VAKDGNDQVLNDLKVEFKIDKSEGVLFCEIEVV
jgi:hypothetical protein